MKNFYTLLAAIMMVVAANAQNTPFVISDASDLGNATWYFLRSCDTNDGGGYQYYDGTNAARSTSYDASNDNYKWAFVGSVTEGIKVYNKGAGKYIANTSLTAGNRCTFDDEGETFQFQATGLFSNGLGTFNNTFYLKKTLDNGNTAYLNNSNNSSNNSHLLMLWTGSADASHLVVENAITYTVTWEVRNSSLETYETVTQQVPGGTTTVTFQKTYPFTTLEGATQTIEGGLSSNKNFTVLATFNTPFTAYNSFDAIEKWYYIQNANNSGANHNDYIYYDAGSTTSIPTQNNNGETDAFMWGFIGNPINGYQIVNKLAGANKYVNASSTSEYPHMADTEQNGNWKLWKGKEENNINYFSFSLGTTTSETASEFWNWQGGSIKWWKLKNENGNFDNGSNWKATEVPAYTFLEEALNVARRYVLGSGLNQYSDPEGKLGDAISTAQALNASSDEATIKAATTALKEGMAALKLNMPQVGTYLRLKSSAERGYLTSPAAGATDNITTSTTSSEDASSVWRYGSDGLLSYYSGQYLGAETTLSSSAVAATIEGNPNYIGTYALRTGDDNYVYSTDRDAAIGRGTGSITSLDDQGYAWTLESVTALPVTLHKPLNSESYYGTFYQPVAVTFDESTKAYVVSNVGTDNVTLTEVTTVPANTGVILVGSSANATATIVDGEATLPEGVDNSLEGSYLAFNTVTAASEEATQGNYYLGQSTGNIGLYRTSISKWDANKAWLPYAAANANAAKGYTFDFGTVTGIDRLLQDATVVPAGAQRYNLAGQRVTSSYKGVVVVGGKKIMVK